MSDLFFIVLLLFIGYYWSDSMKAREIALHAVVMHCQKLELQLLDQYVALNGLWPKRDDYGKIKPWRSYQFEFSSTGDERYNGKIILLGHKVVNIQLDPYRI